MMLTTALGLLALAPAAAEMGDARRADQALAFEARRAGRIQPLDQIVQRVSRQLPGWTYTGFDFEADDTDRAIYKLIFLRDGNVTWMDVDGRTGETLGRR